MFKLLILRFKELFNVIINVILHEYYTMKNVANKKKLRKYV